MDSLKRLSIKILDPFSLAQKIVAGLITGGVAAIFKAAWPRSVIQVPLWVLSCVGLALVASNLLWFWRDRESKKRTQSMRGVALLPRLLVEYVQSLASDRETVRRHYNFSYRSINVEARIDALGNYAGTYTHDAVNDCGTAIGEYMFYLRTTRRLHFAELEAKAWVKVGDDKEVEMHPKSGFPHNVEVLLPVKVPFPRVASNGTPFAVRLQFRCPKALEPGQVDGDALELGRFKSVQRASLKLWFDEPIRRSGWYWLNPKSAKLELYDRQPPSTDEGHTFQIDLGEAEARNRSIYGFFCDFGGPGGPNIKEAI